MIDLHEQKVHEADLPCESGRDKADVLNQTDDRRGRRNLMKEEDDQTETQTVPESNHRADKEEISLSSSNSSHDTLESLTKDDGRLIVQSSENGCYLTAINHPSRRLKASTILIS